MNWLLHHDNASSQLPFSPRIFFTKNNMIVIPHPPYLSVSPLKIKLKGRHVDKSEAMDAESQKVLNTLKEHDFRDTFKKNGISAGSVHTGGRGRWPVGPQLLFSQMAWMTLLHFNLSLTWFVVLVSVP
jgi:hypothetical protein